ncbi:hypothetical protein FKW77_008807 [Venturia effusa]|uniref:Uncharacterized protein n=1 Tax=Venturia effusa TaxID=50376 RepID=A0A517LJI7_9PEZI|nr:hypothetical protein FKW77_008807 [Venturia effusa]
MLSPDTSTKGNSIWDDIDRDQFELNTDGLEASKYRATPWVQARSEWPEDDDRYLVPYAVERQVSDDFAYIAACEPKVVTVTAATLEAYQNPPGIIIRLAGNKGIREYVQRALNEILRNLEQCARKELSQQECADNCLKIVVLLNMNRLFKRIGSRHFEKPKHLALYAKGPISPQWSKLMSKPVQNKQDAIDLAAEAGEFNTVFEQLEAAYTEDSKVQALMDLVKRCFAFTIDGRSLRPRLEKAGYGKKTFSTRPFREINKTAAYWRICLNLAAFARSYRRYFQRLSLVPIQHYNPSTRPGKAEEERFIHAEIQIITYYEINNPPLWPRALGTSKKACFLCYEFIRCHGCFKVSKSHGIVFSRWAVPDRKDYSPESLARLRRTIQDVDARVKEELDTAGMGRIKQDDPVQSSIDLNYFWLPNVSATSLQSPRNSTSAFALDAPPNHEQVIGDADRGLAVEKAATPYSHSQPDKSAANPARFFFVCLMPVLSCFRISSGKKDVDSDILNRRSERSAYKGKQRTP